MSASALKMLAVHTCPLWEDADGTRRPGLTAESDPPRVVGWCNVAVVRIGSERYRLLLTLDASR